VKVRKAGRIVPVAATLAVGVNADRRREVLGMATGASEAAPFWLDFLHSLARRGLRGVKLVVPDAHACLKAAVTKGLRATWQRCRVHFARNALAHAGKTQRRIVSAWIGTAHAQEAGKPRRAAIVIGPEYATVGAELVREAARACRDWADTLVFCGFAFDPQVGETTMNLGRLTVLKTRMSQELRAADAYKAGGGNLFVVFGEPDIALDRTGDGNWIVRLLDVDIFDPTTGEVRSSKKVEEVKADVAYWFVDTDYDGDSFFVS
jgi:hypothetical protein